MKLLHAHAYWSIAFGVRFLFEFYGKISKIMILYLLLPNESKEVLYKIGFILSTSTSKPPLFNYVTFIKKISISEIKKSLKCWWIKLVWKYWTLVLIFVSTFQIYLLEQLFRKFFQNYTVVWILILNIFIVFQVCHNIQYLDICIESDISNEFTDLISVQ